jgi:sortase A
VSLPSAQPKNHKNMPLSVVFVTVGVIIIGSVLMILFISPYQLPDDFAQYANLALARIPSHIVNNDSELPSGNRTEAQIPILLPETPSNPTNLPSFASVAEAPNSYSPLVPNRPQRLVIPALGIDVDVSQVSLIPQEKNGQRFFQWQVPAGYKAGWHENSAPLGQPGNTVLNGHNNIHGELFRYLIDLPIGEKIILYDSDSAYTYEVTQQELLPENGQPISVRLLNARWIEPTQDERLTIVSCWPYATNSHRLVVVAKPVN